MLPFMHLLFIAAIVLNVYGAVGGESPPAVPLAPLKPRTRSSFYPQRGVTPATLGSGVTLQVHNVFISYILGSNPPLLKVAASSPSRAATIWAALRLDLIVAETDPIVLLGKILGSTTPHTTAPTTAPTSVPTPSSGSNVVIDVATNSDINWDGDWVVVTSSCTSSSKAKSCSGSNAFGSGNMMYSFTGEHRTSIYLSVVSNNAQYVVFLDGEETTYGDPHSSSSTLTPGNCTFGWSRTNLSTTPHLFSIMILGASISDAKRDFGSPWSVEVQNLVTIHPSVAVEVAAEVAAEVTEEVTALEEPPTLLPQTLLQGLGSHSRRS
ncbi:hypothetical protein DFH08DRAFT_947983 [Mycena albidolilacea]|uniref:Uncharacterized protein n=1 Tax=Mycena albidolilacea TaxID=1033008 RepID=A0AAD7F7F2_9AGAR|nr:hypothetical protein DFH08DRAFT_947983 [Mycena albidolilacea]